MGEKVPIVDTLGVTLPVEAAEKASPLIENSWIYAWVASWKCRIFLRRQLIGWQHRG